MQKDCDQLSCNPPPEFFKTSFDCKSVEEKSDRIVLDCTGKVKNLDRLVFQKTKGECATIAKAPEKKDDEQHLLYDLTEALILTPKGLTPFDSSSKALYGMKNYDLIQKLPGGYIVAPSGLSTLSIKFSSAFIETSKDLPRDLLVTTLLKFQGMRSFTGADGFGRELPSFSIPDNLPIKGIRPGEDPFTPKDY